MITRTGINGAALARLLRQMGLGPTEFALGAGIAFISAKGLLATGKFPWQKSRKLAQQTVEFLTDRGATPEQIADLYIPENKLAPGAGTPGAAPCNPETNPETTEGEDMVMQAEGIRDATKAHFGLRRSPFVDDVQLSSDVFQSPSTRYARTALDDCAQHHGSIALVGRSGAGKTTLLNDLIDRINESRRSVNVIRPYVLGMESNDRKGKTLKAMDIAEAIIHRLDPASSPKRSDQARANQVEELLKQSVRNGERNVLVIDEAHAIPTPTLVHLKRYLDLRDGHRRVLGIVLMGHETLRDRLSARNKDVAEAVQRFEVIELEPLNADLEAYLKLKLDRIGARYDQVFAPDAADAIRARLIIHPRSGRVQDASSLCYPLAVNNLVCRAMNAAAAVGSPVVDANVIGGC